mmetsp:Transcript_37074/g.66014  ORF Transcript_37074/g.66014 Transcript_37074/m.66014 type:complete len:464 (+) Transcript_37074:190-1581(+)
MSRWRLAVVAVVCCGRAAIASLLFFAGSRWLARTTSISELMLNAVALESVLHVDEFLFTSLAPTSIQCAVQSLPPMRVKRHRLFGIAETALLLCMLMFSMCVPYIVWVEPLEALMLNVKNELCGGNLTFVVGFNPDLQQTIGRVTKGANEDDAGRATMIYRAVDAHIFHGQENTAAFIDFRDVSDSSKPFDEWLQISMERYAGIFPVCWESYKEFQKTRFRPPVGRLADLMELHVRSAAAFLGHADPMSATCEDLQPFCDRPEARLLRFACGSTCGCDSIDSSPLYRVLGYGCAQGCISDIYKMSASQHQQFRRPQIETGRTCEDTPPGPAWNHFWNNYLEAISEHISIQYADMTPVVEISLFNRSWMGKKIDGCSTLLPEMYSDLTNKIWCRGDPGLYRPLAWLCPQSCGCNTSGYADRDKYCWGYDYCPGFVPEGEDEEFKQVAMRYDAWDDILNLRKLQD